MKIKTTRRMLDNDGHDLIPNVSIKHF